MANARLFVTTKIYTRLFWRGLKWHISDFDEKRPIPRTIVDYIVAYRTIIERQCFTFKALMINFSKRAKSGPKNIYPIYESATIPCQYFFGRAENRLVSPKALNKKRAHYLSLCTNDGLAKRFI